MNSRIFQAGQILEKIEYHSILDVGCRDAELKKVIPEDKVYFGNDLFQNADQGVHFVCNIMEINFEDRFDCVVALDIVEHVDDPYALIEKLLTLCNSHLIISLPNTYDLQQKYAFCINNSLGDKYEFRTENRLDRHRWLMNYDEIMRFFKFYAEKHNLSLVTEEVIFCQYSSNILKKALVKFISMLGFQKSVVRTIYGCFTKC